MFKIENIFTLRDIEVNRTIKDWYIHEDKLKIHLTILVNEVGWYHKLKNDNTIFFYHYENLVNKNSFISITDKDNIQDFIFTAFRRKYLAIKYYRLWRIKATKKHYKEINNKDLFLEFLPEKCVSIYEGFNIFRFTPIEINKIILNSIHYNSYQTPMIKQIKNEYTRKNLSKNQLYNIYIELRSSGFCPWLIRQYALVDFNDDIMLYRHYNYLKHLAIKNDVVSLSDDDFKKDVINLINTYISQTYLSTYDINGIFIDISYISTNILRVYLTKAIINHYEISQSSFVLYSKIHKSNVMKDNREILIRFWTKFPDIIKMKNVNERYIDKKSLISISIESDFDDNNDTYDY
tara:strand:- start:21811 stop:22857 length:1047 start_codon:yes stop_codon:yes gene_type:complete